MFKKKAKNGCLGITSWKMAVLVVCAMFFSIVENSTAQTVSILTFVYPPYLVGDGTGIVEQIVTAAFQEEQISVQFQVYPLKRAVTTFQQGEGELFIGLPAYFPDQEIKAIDILSYKRVLVYLKSQYPEFEISTLEELKGKTVGAVLGGSVVLKLAAAGLQVETALNSESNIQKLYNKRLDFVATIDISAINQIRKFYPQHMADFGLWEFDKINLTLIARKNSSSAALLGNFSKGLGAINSKGTYGAILQKFGQQK